MQLEFQAVSSNVSKVQPGNTTSKIKAFSRISCTRTNPALQLAALSASELILLPFQKDLIALNESLRSKC